MCLSQYTYIRFIKYAYFKFYVTGYAPRAMVKKIFNVISIHNFIRNKVHCHIKLISILKEVFILNEFHDLIIE
jgi:hypothetical protein